MKFAIPRLWREPTNRTNDSYFCMVDSPKHQTGKNAPAIVYPSIPSLIAPVPDSDQLAVSIPTCCQDPVSADESTSDEDNITIDDYVLNSNLEEKKHYPNQNDLNDLIRDLGWTKSNAELLTARLKQWNLLDDSAQITKQRKRHQSFSSFFCEMQFAFVTMLVGFFIQLELLLSLVNGVFSLTVHQRFLWQFYSVMATNTHLYLLLIQSI